MSSDPKDPDSSDDHRAWLERLSAVEPLGPPAGDAEREADLLRQALLRHRARLAVTLPGAPADGPAEVASDGDEAADQAQHKRWLKVRDRMRQIEASRQAGAQGLPNQPQASEPRAPLQPDAAQALRPRWRWTWAGTAAGALAASVLAVWVLVERPGDEPRIYDDVPPLNQRGDTTVQRVAAAQPRQAAEALLEALRQAGEPAAIHQHGRTFIVLLQVSSETTPAARAALTAAGITLRPGPLRIDFQPR